MNTKTGLLVILLTVTVGLISHRPAGSGKVLVGEPEHNGVVLKGTSPTGEMVGKRRVVIRDGCDTLYYHGDPYDYWQSPDEYQDDFFTQRFDMPFDGHLAEIRIMFYEDGSSGSPDASIYVWHSDYTYPLDETPPLGSVASFLIPADSLAWYPNWNVIDVSSADLHFLEAEPFHIGYSHGGNPGDTLSILGDDGSQNSNRSTLYRDGAWGTMQDDWGMGLDFCIQAVVCPDSLECQWLSFDGSPAMTPPDVEVTGCGPDWTDFRIIVHGMCVKDTIVGIDTFQYITVPEISTTGEEGRPRLPALGEMMGLTTLADSTTVTDFFTSVPLTFEGYHVFPLQGPAVGGYDSTFDMDTGFYSDSNYFYPLLVAESGPTKFWHTLPVSNLGVFPFVYNPVTDLLMVYDTIDVSLSYPGPPVTDTVSRSFSVMYELTLANHECVFQHVQKNKKNFRASELLLVPNGLQNDNSIKKLTESQKKKGIKPKVEVVAAGTTADNIKTTISTFYTANRTKDVYVLIIGDHGDVPGKVDKFGIPDRYFDEEDVKNILSDQWYALMQRGGQMDFIPDLFIGRIPTKVATTLSGVVDLTIENDKKARGFSTRELVVAGDVDLDVQDRIGPLARLKTKSVVKKLGRAGFQAKQFWGSKKLTNANVDKEIEDGLGDVFFFGHGGETEWYKWNEAEQSWTNTQVDGLTLDAGEETLVWSVCCLNNRIDHTADCIGEHWIKTRKATAHFGCSRSGLVRCSCVLFELLGTTICSYAANNSTVDLGHIINGAMAELHASGFNSNVRIQADRNRLRESTRYTILAFLLLGRPEQTKWLKVPKKEPQPEITHPSSIPTGPQQFEVSVELEGSPLEGAIVSLWKEGVSEDEVFEALYTDDFGLATFDIEPDSAGVMYVTVWGRNLDVYSVEVTVGFTRGDANGDGIINLGDAIFLLNYLFNSGSAPSPPQAGDANCDDSIDISDVIYILNYLFKGGDPPGCD